MKEENIDNFILLNSKYFEPHLIPTIREKLLDVDDSKWSVITSLQFNDPLITLIISVVIGSLGVDRFIIGDIGLGIAKLLTCGGFGVWTIVDWFIIRQAAKEKNLQKIYTFLV